MTPSSLKRGTAFAAAATVGLSTLLLGALPAQATPATCAYGATLISSNVCELTITDTSSSTTITPTVEMGTLEALLVGGGGNGGRVAVDDPDYGFRGGGGGEVRVVGFDALSPEPLTISVGAAATASSATQGTNVQTARAGVAGLDGGMSGSGAVPLTPDMRWSTGGAGAGGPQITQYAGGPGLTPAAVAPATSLFATETAACYGGGGSAWVTVYLAQGSANCGGGIIAKDAAPLALAVPVAARANTGGGGTGAKSNTIGASGVVALRWTVVAAPTASVTFDMQGHGTPVAEQIVVHRQAPVEPAAPAAPGFRFTGWFYDADLTEPADFSTPITDPVTFFAGWVAVPDVPATPEPTDPATAEPTDPATPETGTPTPVPSNAPVAVPTAPSSPEVAAEADALAQTGSEKTGVIGVLGAAVLAAGLAIAGFVTRRARRQA